MDRPRLDSLKALLQVQTVSGAEWPMVNYLLDHCEKAGYHVHYDAHNNVYVTKGEADVYPLIGAHLDTVQRFDDIEICEEGHYLTGRKGGLDRGIGADCKTGIFACLELLQRLPVVKAAFFAGEEIGCVGARNSDPLFFKDVGYFVEFDCPSRDLMSYTSSGQRMFYNRGNFIQAALPVLNRFGVKWQHHPYTDVWVIGPKYRLSCLNLSSGYYNWHADDEYIYTPDLERAIEMGEEVVTALGYNCYPFCLNDVDEFEPLAPVTRLKVTHPHQELRPPLSSLG
jgi:tripeptide aminopeptidase